MVTFVKFFVTLTDILSCYVFRQFNFTLN
jgi:hypothetical protein